MVKAENSNAAAQIKVEVMLNMEL